MWEVERGGSRFAMKIIEKAKVASPAALEALNREIDISRSLDHPCLIHLREVHHSPTKVYLVMEFFPHLDLAAFLDAQPGGKVPEDVARQITANVLRGLVYCHARRVLHRDLKAENVLIDPQSLSVKIIDFGLSVVLGECGGRRRSLCGSYPYMAPEVIQRRGYDPASDVWALGVLLFYLCAGR